MDPTTASTVQVTAHGQLSPSFKFPKTSPLSALSRQTSSSTRRQDPPVLDALRTPWTQYQSPVQPVPSSSLQQPASPLLHSRFRVSTMTEASSKDYSSYMDTSSASIIDSFDGSYRYHDRDSVYSNMTVLPPSPSSLDNPPELWPPPSRDLRPSSTQDKGSFTALPAVVVSSPDSEHATKTMSSVPGRAPLAAPTAGNFSIPVRLPPENTEIFKRRVLERNLGRPPPPFSGHTETKRPASAQPTRARPSSPDRSLSASSSQPAYNQLTPVPKVQSSTYKPPLSKLAIPTTHFSLPSIVVSPAPESPSEHDLPSTPFISDLAVSSRKSAQDYLLLGIEHHEANRLKDSAICFEMSATEEGGCGVGMLMWGLTLRHGWGCPKNEKQGFKWLQKAAQNAVDDLEKARGGMESHAIQSELILAIYEVGQCFFHGWGVAKDRVMAVSYYTVAARLGDADAQQDLAFCLANGKGCKKDKRAAARWHRAAVAQGGSDIGLAWIYKEKYS